LKIVEIAKIHHHFEQQEVTNLATKISKTAHGELPVFTKYNSAVHVLRAVNKKPEIPDAMFRRLDCENGRNR